MAARSIPAIRDVRNSQEKARHAAGFFLQREAAGSGLLHFLGLQALRALGDHEGDTLAFLQRLEAVALDRAEMHEQVFTAFRRDEAEALGIVEPLDRTALTFRHDTYP